LSLEGDEGELQGGDAPCSDLDGQKRDDASSKAADGEKKSAKKDKEEEDLEDIEADLLLLSSPSHDAEGEKETDPDPDKNVKDTIDAALKADTPDTKKESKSKDIEVLDLDNIEDDCVTITKEELKASKTTTKSKSSKDGKGDDSVIEIMDHSVVGSDSIMELLDDDEEDNGIFKKSKSNTSSNLSPKKRSPKTMKASCSSVDKSKSGGDSGVVEVLDDEDDDDLEILGDSEVDDQEEMEEFDDDNDDDAEMESDIDSGGDELNTSMDGKLCIYLSHGSLFVWSAEDAQMLREECRIVGQLTGCLARAPRQNGHLGLPLQLMPEEAKLLVDIDAAVIVREKQPPGKVWRARAEACKGMREGNTRTQQRLYRESRKDEIKRKMGTIIAGKKAKKQKLQNAAKESKNLNKDGSENPSEDISNGSDNKEVSEKESDTSCADISLTEPDVATGHGPEGTHSEGGEGEKDQKEKDLTVEDVMKGDSETDARHTLVQIFTENPWKRKVQPVGDFDFPRTGHERIRYTVFKDLWRKGYYMTSGAKFGGDFLVYPGDPAKYHSHHIALCVSSEKPLPMLDIICQGRLASNVRKTAILCSVEKRKKVLYTSLSWTGIR